MSAPITGLGGDGEILGRFYDITGSQDGWDHCVGSAGNGGVAASLLTLFSPSVSPRNYRKTENSEHVSPPVSPTDVCRSYL